MPAKVSTLTEGVQKVMLTSNLKTTMTVLLVLACASGVMALLPALGQPATAEGKPPEKGQGEPAAPYLVLTVQGTDGGSPRYTITEFDASGKVRWSVAPGRDLSQPPASPPPPPGNFGLPPGTDARPEELAALRDYFTRARKDANAPHHLRVVLATDAPIGKSTVAGLRCCLDTGFEKVRLTGYIPGGGETPPLRPGPDGSAEGYKRYSGESVEIKTVVEEYEKALDRL
jgi:hypothetical protein